MSKLGEKVPGPRHVRVLLAICCVLLLLSVVGIASDVRSGHSDPPPNPRPSSSVELTRLTEGGNQTVGGKRGSRHTARRADTESADGGQQSESLGKGSGLELVAHKQRVQRNEALPCTAVEEPTNFEVFSAGAGVGDVSLEEVERRCGGPAPADEPPPNYTNYVYGDCEIPEGATGCQPPLQVQTWPLCERALGDYTFEGRPLPRRELPSIGGARVFEIEFGPDRRIEVYTRTSTIVIFAFDYELAVEALDSLSSQPLGKPMGTTAEELESGATNELGAPPANAIKGELPC